ncbi:MAG: WD40/YVTN/BNR-like repeat-containing protein, partial [Bacillota bacterium]
MTLSIKSSSLPGCVTLFVSHIHKMKAAKTIALLFFMSQGILAQSLPKTYMLNETNTAFEDSPAGNDIGDIIAFGDTVIVSTGAGLSRSSNRGESWTDLLRLAPSDNKGISALTYSNGVIWAAFHTEEEQLGEMQPAGAGLMYSTDRGVNWNYISQPIDQKTDTLIIYGKNILRAVPIHTKIANITYDIAVINNTVWIASWAGGLRKSSDMGKTWQRVVLPTDSLDRISPEDTLTFKVKSQDLNESVFSIA